MPTQSRSTAAPQTSDDDQPRSCCCCCFSSDFDSVGSMTSCCFSAKFAYSPPLVVSLAANCWSTWSWWWWVVLIFTAHTRTILRHWDHMVCCWAFFFCLTEHTSNTLVEWFNSLLSVFDKNRFGILIFHFFETSFFAAKVLTHTIGAFCAVTKWHHCRWLNGSSRNLTQLFGLISFGTSPQNFFAVCFFHVSLLHFFQVKSPKNTTLQYTQIGTALTWLRKSWIWEHSDGYFFGCDPTWNLEASFFRLIIFFSSSTNFTSNHQIEIHERWNLLVHGFRGFGAFFSFSSIRCGRSLRKK